MDLIIDRIRKNKCVLLLGPDFYYSGKDTLSTLLENYMATNNGKKIDYLTDEMYSFDDDKQRILTYMHINGFFEQLEVLPLYQQITEIPLHLIINLSPDLLLRRAFEKVGAPHNFDYYNKTTNTNPLLVKPDKDKPFIYNLLGNVEDEDSLVYSYNELFEYLIAIFGNFQIHNTLKAELKAADTFIIAGVKLDKWYMKLLMRILDLQDKKIIHAFTRESNVQDETKRFYNKTFKVEFIEKDVPKYIAELHEKCKALNILRKPLVTSENKPENPLKTTVKQHIAKNEIEPALSKLLQYFSTIDNDIVTELIMQSGAYNDVNTKIRYNLIKAEDVDISLSKIRFALLNIADKI